MKQTILITGGDGYIAQSLYNKLKNAHKITLINRNDVDICNKQAVAHYFSDKQFDVVIHTAITGGKQLLKDDDDVLYDNIEMYVNLARESKKYNKFINIGSGAEFFKECTPYGRSKVIINNLINKQSNFYNLRVFAVFDQNELDTRFIKASINRALNAENVVIHQDKYMDFIYMDDFCKIIQHYIQGKDLEKSINCCYEQKQKLSEIAEVIIQTINPELQINIIDNTIGEPYHGSAQGVPKLNFIGLSTGIKNTIKELIDLN